MKAMYLRYHKAVGKKAKGEILGEFCKVYKCHRKSAIRMLNGPAPVEKRPKRPRGRKVAYPNRLIEVLEGMWRASNYLWSRNLKAAVPLWIDSLKARYKLSPQEVSLLLQVSPSTIDRRLASKKRELKGRLYGKTQKSSYLLRNQIPIRTEFRNVSVPGLTEADTVSHSGPCASGLFAQTLNQTSILTQWGEQRALLGKGDEEVCRAMGEMDEAFPFEIIGIDTDNGSEFINARLESYCRKRRIKFTRSRPYKKDDQAHIEQKNKMHVRKWVGWLRYDTPEVVAALNDLYQNELRLFQNLFQPSIRLIKTIRRGSRSRRVFDAPQTPLDRVIACGKGDPKKLAHLIELRQKLDPFQLSCAIDRKLKKIYSLASKTPLLQLPTPRPRKSRFDPWRSPGFDRKTSGWSPEVSRSRRLYGKERSLKTW